MVFTEICAPTHNTQVSQVFEITFSGTYLYTSHNLVESSQISKAGEKRNQILPYIAVILKIQSLLLVQHVSVGLLSGAPLPPQAGHGTAAGLSHPGDRHQQAERVPVDLQRTSGQPGPGPPAGLTQALHAAGMLHPHRALQDVKQSSRVFLMSEHHSHDLQIALKCADVCNPCRVWELSRQWSERVCEEFYRQGESSHMIEIPT